MRKIIIPLLAAPLYAMATPPLYVQFEAKLTLNAVCTISAEDVVFGVVDPVSMSYASNNIFVICNNELPYIIQGKNFVANNALRLTNNGTADYLDYMVSLRSDFKDGFWFEPTYKNIYSVGSGLVQTIPLYYRTNSGKRVKPTSYQDNYTIMLTY